MASARLDALPPPAVPRAEVIDELYEAVVNGKAPLHDGAWAMATLEVLLAMLRSAREGSEVRSVIRSLCHDASATQHAIDPAPLARSGAG